MKCYANGQLVNSFVFETLLNDDIIQEDLTLAHDYGAFLDEKERYMKMLETGATVKIKNKLRLVK